MASKWSHLKGQFDTATDDPGWFAEVQKRMDIVKVSPETGEPRTMSELTSLLNTVEDEKDSHESRISELNIDQRALHLLILREMETADCEAWRGNGYTYSEKVEPSPSVADKRALREWALANGAEDLLTIHSKTLESECKNRITEGRELPDGVKIFVRTKVHRTKSRG